MKVTMITGLMLALMIGSAPLAQDTEAKPLQDKVDGDAKDALTEALKKSSGFGGMKIEGAVAPVEEEREEGEEEEGERRRRGRRGGFGGRSVTS